MLGARGSKLQLVLNAIFHLEASPGNLAYSDYEFIKRHPAVKTAILQEKTLSSAEINVETFKGIVQLSGFVSSVAQTETAVAVARNVNGVKSVRNDMRIKGQQ